MSHNDQILANFSTGFIVVMAMMLVVPVLRRRSDVFTAWNFFLVGAIIFNGLSAFNCVNHAHYLDTYRPSDYTKYYLGLVLFYTSISLTYHYFRFPRKLAGRNFLKWPALTPGSAPIIVTVLAGFVIFQKVQIPIPGVRELLFQGSLIAPTVAFACAFVVWYRNRSNVLLLGLLVGVGLLSLLASASGGISRRYLISTLSAAPVALYWVWLRYKPTTVIITVLTASILTAVPILTGFTLIRFALQEEDATITERAAKLVEALPNAIKKGGSVEGFMGQDSVEAALMTIHLLNDGSRALEVYPFYSVIYIAVNPIPRSIWPEKPRSLGVTLPKTSGLTARGIDFNIGVNVIAQCYYDGGLLIHLLYGFLFGSFLRFMDELLVRQPGNPYVIGTVVAMSGQIIGWPRGGIETMGLQILLAFAFMIAICWFGRIVMGSGLVFQRSDHLDPYPNLRSENDWQRGMGSAPPGQAVAARPRYRDHG